jgi:hypothetical protein
MSLGKNQDEVMVLARQDTFNKLVRMVTTCHSKGMQEVQCHQHNQAERGNHSLFHVHVARIIEYQYKFSVYTSHAGMNKLCLLSRQVTIQKPCCIADYDSDMGGGDYLDQQLSYYQPRRKIIKWHKKMPMYLIQIAMSNAFALSRWRTPRQRSVPSFIFSACKSWATPQPPTPNNIPMDHDGAPSSPAASLMPPSIPLLYIPVMPRHPRHPGGTPRHA